MPKITPKKLTSEISAKPLRPVVQDVDFQLVSTVLLDGVAYRVRFLNNDVIAELRTTEVWNEEEADAKESLQLERNENGLVLEETFSLLNLRELTWDEKQTAFVDLPGTTYEFLCWALRGKA